MQRKVFGAEFKAKVALEALAGRQTVNEIAGAYEAHLHQVATWKREAMYSHISSAAKCSTPCVLNQPIGPYSVLAGDASALRGIG